MRHSEAYYRSKHKSCSPENRRPANTRQRPPRQRLRPNPHYTLNARTHLRVRHHWLAERKKFINRLPVPDPIKLTCGFSNLRPHPFTPFELPILRASVSVLSPIQGE